MLSLAASDVKCATGREVLLIQDQRHKTNFYNTIAGAGQTNRCRSERTPATGQTLLPRSALDSWYSNPFQCCLRNSFPAFVRSCRPRHPRYLETSALDVERPNTTYPS